MDSEQSPNRRRNCAYSRGDSYEWPLIQMDMYLVSGHVEGRVLKIIGVLPGRLFYYS